MIGQAQILVGHIEHRRTRPHVNQFTYPIFNVRLPIAELDSARPPIRVGRFGLVSFNPRDHGYCDDRSLQSWANAQLQAANVDERLNIELVCLPRVLGHVFNPVSFWLCWTQEGALRAMIAEVRNTFGERLSYVLQSTQFQCIANGETLRATKRLHVSPFNEVRGEYQFQIFVSEKKFLVRIDYDDQAFSGPPLLHTHISCDLQPMTAKNLRWASLKMPLISLQVVAKIHWQALKLWRLRVPFFGYLPSEGKR